jgi:hypothetical protein
MARLAVAATAAAGAKLYATPHRTRAVMVEDVVRCQADIGDFFFAQSNFVTRDGIPRRRISCGRGGCCGYSTRQRQRQSRRSQQCDSFAIAFRHQSRLRVRHGKSPINERHVLKL